MLYLDVNSIFFYDTFFHVQMYMSPQSSPKNRNECRWCALSAALPQKKKKITVTFIQCNLDIAKGQGNGKNLFPITSLRYMEVLFHIFHYCGGKQNRSLYPGLRYIGVLQLSRFHCILVHGFNNYEYFLYFQDP